MIITYNKMLLVAILNIDTENNIMNNMPAKLALMLEISWKKIYTDGLKIFRSQDLLPVSLETRVQYGGGKITRSREFDWV